MGLESIFSSVKFKNGKDVILVLNPKSVEKILATAQSLDVTRWNAMIDTVNTLKADEGWLGACGIPHDTVNDYSDYIKAFVYVCMYEGREFVSLRVKK